MSGAVHQHSSTGRIPPAIAGQAPVVRPRAVLTHDKVAIGHLIPNTDLAVNVLEILDSDGRHDLFAINPDLPEGAPGQTEARTFLAHEHGEMRAWIDENQGRRNIYYGVNRAKDDAPRDRRLRNENIGYLRAIPGDIDVNPPGVGEAAQSHQIAERERLTRLAGELSDSDHAPTLMVDTGGLQPIWLLVPPVPATPENVALVEGIGRTLQRRYGRDSVFDPARVMRLPGTINLLNPEKRAQGRVATVVTVPEKYTSAIAFTLSELAALVPPTAVTPRDKGKGDWRKVPIDMDAIAETQACGALPPALSERFDAFKVEKPAVAELWDGKPAPWQKGLSASEFEFALVNALKGRGFTPTEIGHIVAIFPHRSVKHEDELQRRVANAWLNANVFPEGSLDPAKHGFDPYYGVAWEPPGDLWAVEDQPPALPAGVLPEIVECVAWDRAQRLGVAPGAPAAALVTVLGSLVSAGNRLQMRQRDPDWTVKPILWTAIIGLPGSNKSATINAATSVVHAIEGNWRQEFAAAEAKRREAERSLEHRKGKAKADDAAAADDSGTDTDQVFAGIEGEQPRFRQKLVNDATTEALAVILSENPGGLLYHADELAGWLGGMDAYRAKGGKDRPFWLQAKEGGPFTVNRRGNGRTCVDNLAVSILGGIQPEKIKALGLGMTDDGLLQRFAPIRIERTGEGQDIDPIPGLAERLGRTASGIVASEQKGTFRFSPEANAELAAIEAFKSAEISRPDTSPHLQQWLEKIPNEFGRVALVFHFIEWHGGAEGALCGGPPPALISQATAHRARRYLTEFTYRHARVFYQRDLGRTEIEEHAVWVAGFILSGERETISTRDVYRSYPALKHKDRRGDIPAVMWVLEMFDWVKPAGWRNGQSTHWQVNPAVHDGRFSIMADKERARRTGVRDAIAAEAEDRRAVG